MDEDQVVTLVIRLVSSTLVCFLIQSNDSTSLSRFENRLSFASERVFFNFFTQAQPPEIHLDRLEALSS